MLWMFLAMASAADVKLCVQFQNISYSNDGAGYHDYWTGSLQTRPARGVKLQVKDAVSGAFLYEDFVGLSGANAGCATVSGFVVNADYVFTVFSEAEIHDDSIRSYNNTRLSGNAQISSSTTLYTHVSGPPGGVPMEVVGVPSGTVEWRNLATATWTLYRLHSADGPQDYSMYYNAGSGCSAGLSGVNCSSQDKHTISHELGHHVLAKGSGGSANTSYDADEEHCDDSDAVPGKHRTLSQEFQSAAASEGWADVYSALAWNRVSDSDCYIVRGYSSAFGGGPSAGTRYEKCYGDIVLPFDTLDGRDWLEDASALGLQELDNSVPSGMLGACSSSLVGRSTQFDHYRFWWAIRKDQGVLYPDMLQLMIDSDPVTWEDTTGVNGILSDDANRRIRKAFVDAGWLSKFQAEKDHGLDH